MILTKSDFQNHFFWFWYFDSEAAARILILVWFQRFWFWFWYFDSETILILILRFWFWHDFDYDSDILILREIDSERIDSDSTPSESESIRLRINPSQNHFLLRIKNQSRPPPLCFPKEKHAFREVGWGWGSLASLRRISSPFPKSHFLDNHPFAKNPPRGKIRPRPRILAREIWKIWIWAGITLGSILLGSPLNSRSKSTSRGY